MIRIILPLAIVAAMFLGPMYAYPSDNPVSGRSEQSIVTGDKFIGGVIDCVRKLEVPLGKECASEAVINNSKLPSQAMSLAAIISLAAAVIGILGMLPFVGRLTSIVTMLAGLSVLGAMGLFLVTMMGTKTGLPAVQWGAYLTAGVALITTISGLSGMRGR